MTRETRRKIAQQGFHGVHDAHTFTCVRKRGAHYEVDCGWRTPEAYDDDYMSHTYQPLQGGAAPWVGRRVVVDTLDEAVAAYDEAVAAMAAGSGYPRPGTEIGSVSR